MTNLSETEIQEIALALRALHGLDPEWNKLCGRAADAIRELQRQNDELRAELDGDDLPLRDKLATAEGLIASQLERMAALQRQVAEREADARRYRWLRDWAQSYQMHEWFKSGLSLQQIDAAIDKAIASNKHLTPPKDQTP